MVGKYAVDVESFEQLALPTIAPAKGTRYMFWTKLEEWS